MKQVFRYDKEGYYAEPVILQNDEDVPSDCSDKMPSEGLYKAQFVDGEWVEGMNQEEVDAIKNILPVPDPLEEIKKQQELMQQAIDDLILGGML